MRRAIDIQLDEAMRQQLERVSRRPSASVRLVERVQIVLLAAEGLSTSRVASTSVGRRRGAGETGLPSVGSRGLKRTRPGRAAFRPSPDGNGPAS